jgi:predicted RNA-binding protein YlxR (DUF448 family)
MPHQTPLDDAALTDTADETDAGPSKKDQSPERRCIATMESRPQAEMIRFVVAPDGTVTPDLAMKLPGRGAWVTSSREAVDLAAKKGAFGRAFKAQVKVPANLSNDIEALLVKRALDMLGLAKRAGDLILGFDQVRELVRGERPGCLIEASDGAADGRSKVLGLVRAAHGPAYGKDIESRGEGTVKTPDLPPVIGCFSADELGMALGRERVIHACLKQGRFARSWMGELTRLSGFRRDVLVEWRPVEDGPDLGDSRLD